MGEPDLWIGVDLGMTFTGVAYSARGWTVPKLIQDWPGREGVVESKVPTVLTYEGKRLTSWGFECEDPDESEGWNKKEYKWFKLFLDEAVLEQSKSKFLMKDVEKWYKDFLTELYKHVKATMIAQQPRGWKGKVQFLFSVPTTWNKATLNRYEKAIKAAGFGKEKKHSIKITWTEAQAAAIYTAKNMDHTLEKHDVLLVCDAGGGTTDLAVLEQTGNAKEGGVPQLKELDRVFGVQAGSTQIDTAFTDHVVGCLTRLEQKHPNECKRIQDVEVAAEKMMKGTFQRYKCAFGKDVAKVNIKIPIPGLATSFSSQDCGIDSGKLIVTKEQMTEFFDPQLRNIFKAIDHQLKSLYEIKRDKKVDYLVLSGGLGSSVHIMNGIQKRYVDDAPAAKYQNIGDLTVLRADDPRVAVVKGLIMDRTQSISVGQPVLKTFLSRSNYGFLCVKPYNSDIHLLKDTYQNPFDQKLYVDKLIKWVVEKGDDLKEDTCIPYPCTRMIDPDSHNPLKGWKTVIVTSNNSNRDLPRNLSEGGVEELCVLRSDLSQFDLRGGDFEEYRPNFFARRKGKKACFTAKYEIRVIVGAANIKFELWFKGHKCGENAISVSWGPGASAPVNPEIKDILCSE